MFKRVPNPQTRRLLFVLPLVLIVASLACSMPSLRLGPTPTSQAILEPTFTSPPPTPSEPLPPALVESIPSAGSEIALDGAITLYFNQTMDRASVERALDVQPDVEGELVWVDDASLAFNPTNPLAPESQISLNLDASAKSAQGLALQEPVTLRYQTAGPVRLAESLPRPDSVDVDPTSAVVAAFNKPMVPLGADPADLPAAFELDPTAEGRGEWLNTSTYIFYPEPGLEGGRSYLVRLNPELRAADGGPLESAASWGFSTAYPRLSSVEPGQDRPLPLDAEFILTFNQPMDADSVLANLQINGPSGAIGFEPSWNDERTELSLTPSNLLARGSRYTLTLGAQASGRGGTPIGAETRLTFDAMPRLAVLRTRPGQEAVMDPQASLELHFSAPIVEQDALQYITLSPEVPNLDYWWNPQERILRLYGNFAPSTQYTLNLSAALQDPWGGTLPGDFTLTFRTDNLRPNLVLTAGSTSLYLTPQDNSLQLQVTNIFNLPVTRGDLPLQDFLRMIGPNGYAVKQSYQPANPQSWTQTLEIPGNRSQAVDLFLSPDRQPLAPGLYFLRFDFIQEGVFSGPFILAVSDVHLTFKLSATEALVWAVDLSQDAPLSGAPVSIYADDGTVLASGETDADGVLRTTIPTIEDPYREFTAVIGQPGDANFAMALSSWSQGISSWDFDLRTDLNGPRLKVYLYSDRPIYRPGQTVYFRGVARQAYNGRYDLPDLGSLPLVLNGPSGEELASFDLSLSAFGTAHGQYALPDGASPGVYSLRSPLTNFAFLDFQVAEYRKPEINLQASFDAEQALAGQPLEASISARYFFDAPAGDLPIGWRLYAAPSYFSLPHYQVGPQSTDWLEFMHFPQFPGSLGELVAEGQAQTDAQGLLRLELPAGDAETQRRQRYTLEITAQDESGLPVSTRAEIQVNPAQFYIGLRPDAWVGRAGEATGFDIQVVDWQQEPTGQRSLQADFKKVVWVRQDPGPQDPYFGPTYQPQYTLIDTADGLTNSDGQARLSFTPPEPGTYILSVSGEGALSEVLLWVGGPGQAVWPALPNQRIELTPDRESYQPGDTAQVFVPNPLGEEVLALVTTERGTILSNRVIRLEAGGGTIEFELSAEEAPNVYVSVTLLGRQTDFRQGFVNLPVAPLAQTFEVTLTSEPQRLGPGEPVRFEIRVTDAEGNPLQGEFSFSVVDLAALALADPNSPDIVSAFYGEQPLGVRTSLAMAAYGRRNLIMPPGIGGGGGGFDIAQVVREDFPDTAYWNAELVTDADGRAQVELQLPDSLTTWQVEARGLTPDTQVGQAQTQVVATKDLLVRPVTPRFLTAGDHVQLAAVVQNNTGEDLQVQVTLQGQGIQLDDPAASRQEVSVTAGGRTRVEWWASVEDVDSLDLVFSAEGGGLQDAARPALGALPVLRYTARQTFRTAGVMDEAGERLELVSLPRSFDPQAGELSVELSPSLGSAMISALEAVENTPYEGTEPILSSFLPNLETYRALTQFGVQAPALKANLDRSLVEGVQRLQARQNPDGGWPWWNQGESDPYVSAYVLFGLSRAQQSGIGGLSSDAIPRGAEYLRTHLGSPEGFDESWQFDRLVFQYFALIQSGHSAAGDLEGQLNLYEGRERLNPWGQALLALNLESLSPGSQEARTLISDLETAAIRSAAGAHWETEAPQWRNMVTTLSNSAIVLYTLGQREPGSPLLADAVRYLMAHKDVEGGWSSTYTTAWSLMALSQVIKGTGELGGDFSFDAALNHTTIASGSAAGAEQLAPAAAAVPVGSLIQDYPNLLAIRHGPGSGRLYYSAALHTSRPVESIPPLEAGMSVQRSYHPAGEACPNGDCPAIEGAQAGDRVTARLTLTLSTDMYYLILDDYIPAGAEILDTRLKTSQLGGDPQPAAGAADYDPRRPFEGGWGWWYFDAPQIYDDHITWTADYLPAGTYELTYTLVILQPGEYRVLPAHARQFYFPEVQGNNAGGIFTITP